MRHLWTCCVLCLSTVSAAGPKIGGNTENLCSDKARVCSDKT